MAWTINNIPSQKDRVAFVTGANSGLGFQTCKALLSKGCTVVMGCRSLEKAKEASKRILLDIETPGDIEALEIDLADLNKVACATDQLAKRFGALDLLINNAGLMAPPKTLSSQGYEIQFAVNHLAHMALTIQLLPLLSKGKGSRVVTVTSGAQYMGNINWNDLHGNTKYDRWKSYSQSKLANVMFALELEDRLRKSNSKVKSLAAHPGLAKTNLQATSVNSSNAWQEEIAYKLMTPMFQSALMGALPQLFAATDLKVKGGQHYGPRFNFRGSPRLCRVASAALDPLGRERLWAVSEKMISQSIID